jgi:hypothetical protein
MDIVNEIAHKEFNSGDLIKNLILTEPCQIMALLEFPSDIEETFSQYGLSEIKLSDLLLKCNEKGKKELFVTPKNKYPFEFVDKVLKILKLMNREDIFIYEKNSFPLLIVIDSGENKKVGFAVAPKLERD